MDFRAYTYFLVEPDGETAKAISDEVKKLRSWAKKGQELLKEIGASDIVENGHNRIAGVTFDKQPNKKEWLLKKSIKGIPYYMPRRNTQERRELAERLENYMLERPGIHNVIKGVGIVIRGSRIYEVSYNIFQHAGGSDHIIGIPNNSKNDEPVCTPPDCKRLKLYEYFMIREQSDDFLKENHAQGEH